jgi:hypothetical protein
MSESRLVIPSPLRGLRVGITGAVPEPESWGKARALDQTILRFVSQLSGLVLKYGGEVVHGSHPSFTPVIATQARHFQSESATKALTLIASELFGDPPPVVVRCADVARVVLTPRIGDPKSPQIRDYSLTALRLALAQEIDVVVAVGTLHASSSRPTAGSRARLTETCSRISRPATA